jgi:hypothetical protein
MEYTKYIHWPVTVVRCDFCDKETIWDSKVSPQRDGVYFNSCVCCGKDVCNNHKIGEVEACEDGVLCPVCSKKFEFDTENGGVGVVDKETGTEVDAPYL